MHDLIGPLYAQAEELRKHLIGAGEPSFASFVDDNFRKVLLLAAASAFEARLTNHVLDFARSSLSDTHPLVELIKRKAIDRQYHTWFNWESANANQFFGLFGERFRAYASTRLAADQQLQEGCKNFLELGDLRNRLVHRNFSVFTLEKTTDELFGLFTSACNFVDKIPDLLADFERYLG